MAFEYARCEECHRTMITLKGEFIAEDHFVCCECMGECKPYTLKDFERSERE